MVSVIGQSTFSLEKRKGEHLKGSQRQRPRYYIHRAIRKYGMDGFTWEVLYECDTHKELDQAELKLIEQHNALVPNGYNMVYMAGGGDTFTNHPKKETIRKRMSEGTLKGIAASDKSWSHFGSENSMYGKKHSAESIEKMSENRKGLTDGEKNPSAINAGTYKIFLPNGETKIVKNIRQWCRENNLPHFPFYNMCNGKQTVKYKGKYWCERISMDKKMARKI